jgi:hypothetical protein
MEEAGLAESQTQISTATDTSIPSPAATSSDTPEPDRTNIMPEPSPTPTASASPTLLYSTPTPTWTIVPTLTATSTEHPEGCGNGACQLDLGENTSNCPSDCQCIDNGICDAAETEICSDCGGSEESYVLFFDDFDGDTLNTGVWYQIGSSSNWEITVGSSLVVIDSGTTLNGGIGIETYQQFEMSGSVVIIEMRVQIDQSDGGRGRWGFYGGGLGMARFGADTNHYTLGAYADAGTGTVIEEITGINPGTWHIYRVEVTAVEVRYYIDGSLVKTISGLPFNGRLMPVNFVRLCSTNHETISIDYVEVSREG